MASHEIVPLQCPSCGSADTGPSKPLAFGAEFTCAKCGDTSVLIINRALLPIDALQKSGERVCVSCGRIALRDARFCQEGHSLVRRCINQDCLKEFAIDHQRCDFCGWAQEVKPGTVEGAALEIERAINELGDPSHDIVFNALHRIRTGGDFARAVADRAVPAILDVLNSPYPKSPYSKKEDWYDVNEGWNFWRYTESDKNPEKGSIEKAVWLTLASLGSAASAAAPTLCKTIEDCWSAEWKVIFLLRCLASISPSDALALCKRIAEVDTSSRRARYAINIAFLCGPVAIPVLQKFSNFFDDNGAKSAIRCLREGRPWTMPPTYG